METVEPLSVPAEKRIVVKDYSKRHLPKTAKGKRQMVSLQLFKKDLGIFDPEMKAKYSNAQIVTVMKLIFKKCVQRIIAHLWRMPFPNGSGRLYMKESQVSRYATNDDGKIVSDRTIECLLRECQLGMKNIRLTWNREGVSFPYRDVWTARRSEGHFRSTFFEEVISRAEDPTKKTYKGHIV